MKKQQTNDDEEKRGKRGKEKESEIYSLEPKFVFGLTPGLSNNCFFLNDYNIIYHAAGVLVIHDISVNSQHFIYLKEPQKIITTMELNNTKYEN